MYSETIANDTTHTCPYCGHVLYRPAEVDPKRTALASRLARPMYVETRVRDINIGFAFGLAVVLFMDIGVFVRRDTSPFGFTMNLLIAATFTVLLPLWYWRMRVDSAVANAERYAAYQQRLETWNHTYWCAACDAVFVRE